MENLPSIEVDDLPQVLVEALLVGLLCGLLPAIVAGIKGKWYVGVGSLVLCVIVGFLWGIRFVAPLAVLATLVIIALSSELAGCLMVAAFFIITGIAGAYFTKNTFMEAFRERDEIANTEDSRFRIFTSKDGETIEARIVSLKGNSVSLIRRDGESFVTKLSRFSETDQEYIRGQFTEQ